MHLAGCPASSATRRFGFANLRLSVHPSRVPAEASVLFVFRVTAPRGGHMRPLAGASVRFDGAHARTNAHGIARLTRNLPRAQLYGASTTKRGFTTGHAAVRATAAAEPRFTG